MAEAEVRRKYYIAQRAENPVSDEWRFFDRLRTCLHGLLVTKERGGEDNRKKAAPIGAALLASALILATPVHAEEAKTIEVEIPSQSADAAIRELARIYGRSVVFPAEDVAPVTANALAGTYDVEEALDRLFAGTSLTGGLTNSGVITVSRRNNAQPVGDTPVKKSAFLLTSALAAFVQSAFTASAQDGEGTQARGDTIVVTARKREEGIQEVPLSVTALDGESIAVNGIEDVSDLYARVPGLYFTYGGGASPTADFSYIAIRGVGFNGGLEPATGVFIDGMYTPQIDFDSAFLDVERVEILRGPQGTLFGRNTQAGAINIVTRKPGEEFHGSIQAGYAKFDTKEAMASLSGPIGGDFYAAISASYNDTKGYIENANTGEPHSPSQRVAARGVLRWVPTDAFEAMIIGDVSFRDYNEMDFGVPLVPEAYVTTADPLNDDERNSNGVQLNMNYDVTSEISVTSITGVRETDSDVTFDFDGVHTPTDNITLFPVPAGTPRVDSAFLPISGIGQRLWLNQRYISQELRFEGSHEIGGMSVDWLAGGFYFDQRQKQDRDLDIGPDVPFTNLFIRESFQDDRDGHAFFGQVSIRPIPALEITGGVRYSKESVDSFRDRVLQVDAGGVFLPFPVVGDTNSATFDNVSFLASASYDITDSVLAYFTFSQGWKAGGINRFPSRSGYDLEYGDETSNNYEIGLKSTLFGGRATANITGYWVTIEDQQMLNTVPDPNGGTPIAAIANVGSSRVRGVEAEISAAITDYLDFSANVAYSDTEFVDASKFGYILNGLDFLNVPELTSQQIVTYRQPVSGEWSAELRATGLYVSSYDIEDGASNAGLGDRLTVDSYYRVDLSASLVSEDGWRVTFYVNNVADTFDYNLIARYPYAAVPLDDTSLLVHPLSPRVFGGRIRKSF